MINFGLIGLGRFAKNYIKVINSFDPEARISMVCSRNARSYLDLQEQKLIKDPHIWKSDYKEICKNKLTDAIIVCTPPDSHYEITKFALENGKHVICEKPFVFRTEEAKELTKLAKDNKLCLVVNYIHLWNKFYQKARDFYLKNNVNEIKFCIENPRTGREHCGLLWDWLTHEASMISHLGLDDFKIQTIVNGSTNEDINLLISKLTSNKINVTLTANINSNKKLRSIYIGNDTDSLLVYDTFDGNPLQEMLLDFCLALKNNIIISNGDVAIKTTKLLNKIEKTIHA